MTASKLTRRMILGAGAAASVLGMGGYVPQLLAQSRDVEGGIGGTGIVGLLNEFGSLYINGLYVQTDDNTDYSDGFGKLAKSNLSLGNSLTVEARNTADGLVAHRVHVTYPIVGLVSSVRDAGQTLRVNGVTVRLTKANRRVSVGDRMAVSGLWRGQTVIASQLSPARSKQDLISGDVIRTRGATFIGGIRVRGGGVAQAPTGSFATALGTFDPQASEFSARQTIVGRFFGAAGPLQALSIEGYLDPINRAPGYRVSGLGHSFERTLQLDKFANSRVLFAGPYTGKFAARSATVLPENTRQRLQVLRGLRRPK